MRSALILAIALMTQAFTAQAELPSTRFTYRADGKRLTEVLQDFAASQTISIVIDAGVDGSVNGQFDAKPAAFLDALGKSYGIIWYYDGVTLFVYPSRMMQSRLFRMRGYSRDSVSHMLSSMGLGDPRFPLRFNDVEQTLLAYGPPRHIELVQTVIDTLDGTARDRVGAAIRVFPLINVTAADRVSGNVRVPGLATTLNNLFTRGARAAGGAPELNSAGGGDSSPNGNPSKRRAMEMAYGARAADPQGGSSRKDGVRDAAGRLIVPEVGSEVSQDDVPFFQADEASNSIIVRGVPERMSQYQELIRQLDVPQALVEIEATIIDVSSESYDSLGIEWEFSRAAGGSLAVSSGSPSVGTSNGPAVNIGLPNVTTLVSNAGRSLLARIRALESTGNARVLAHPKVLGTANRMASMIDKRQASVRVAGNLDVGLFTVEAGTTLQVMPQIVLNGGRREVRLSLYIEDGSFEGALVDSIPIIKKTEIRTDAALLEGESLLIGGISVETDTTGRSGLPGLSKVPLVGGLFRHDEGVKSRRERLFLITPKLVSLKPTAELQLPAGVSSPVSPQPPAAPPLEVPAKALPHAPAASSVEVPALVSPQPPVVSPVEVPVPSLPQPRAAAKGTRTAQPHQAAAESPNLVLLEAATPGNALSLAQYVADLDSAVEWSAR